MLLSEAINRKKHQMIEFSYISVFAYITLMQNILCIVYYFICDCNTTHNTGYYSLEKIKHCVFLCQKTNFMTVSKNRMPHFNKL